MAEPRLDALRAACDQAVEATRSGPVHSAPFQSGARNIRAKLTILAAALLALAISGCAQSQPNGAMGDSYSSDTTSYAHRDPELDCPSGNCQGLGGTGIIGGNHNF